MAEFVAIITAAGKGSRMQAECKKQFLLLQGKSILERTIANFLAMDLFSRLVVVLPSDEFEEAKKRLGQHSQPVHPRRDIQLHPASLWAPLLQPKRRQSHHPWGDVSLLRIFAGFRSSKRR